MICTVCGSAAPDGAKFCMECGAALSIPDAPIPEETVAQPASFQSTPTADTGDAVSAPAEEVCDAASLPEDTSEEEPSAQVSSLPSPAPVSSHPAQPQATPAITRKAAKKGTHWIPIAIMAVLCVFGLALFLALPFGSASTPTTSSSETPWFHNDNGTLYFNRELYQGPEELAIPDLVDGQPITELSTYCFAGCDFITVILPDSLEAIGAHAFDGCTKMRGIFLPEGLVYIGNQAFYCCSELEAICIPSTVETIEPGAFDGCFDLDYILYNGTQNNWLELYSDMIGKKTQVYCVDGTFVHQKVFP